MLLRDILSQAYSMLGEKERSNPTGYFSPQQMRLMASTIMQRIAEITHCTTRITSYVSVAANEHDADLPVDFEAVSRLQVSGEQPLVSLPRKPQFSTWPSGTMREFYIENKTTLFVVNAPTATTSLEIDYVYRPPLYAFMIEHDGSGGVTNSKFSVTATSLILSRKIAGTWSSDTISLTAAATDSMAELVAAINALTATKGFSAQLNSGCLSSETSTHLEVIADVDLTDGYSWAFLDPVIPDAAMSVVVNGLVEYGKFKDREAGAYNFENSKTMAAIQGMAVRWDRENRELQNHPVREIYGLGGIRRANGGMRLGDGDIIYYE